MALKNSRIYPEIYSVNKLKRGCPDGAVFYAHPPFGNLSDAEDPEGRVFIRRVLNYVYGSAHISNHNYTYWEKWQDFVFHKTSGMTRCFPQE